MRLYRWLKGWVLWFLFMAGVIEACKRPATVKSYIVIQMANANRANKRIRDEVPPYPKRQFWPWQVRRAEHAKRERERIIDEEMGKL